MSRYRRYDGGDPLAPPVDIAEALDAIGQDVMAGYSPERAMREFLRRGGDDQAGLDDLGRRVAERRRELLQRHNLDGTLNEVRELLEKAVLEERKQLARDALMDDGDRAFREMRMQNLPDSPAAAVTELNDYDWQSSEAREAFEQIKDLLGRELLDQRFSGMKQALENATDEDRQAINEMLSDLNELLEKHARGEDTPEDFQEFMAQHGQHFPEDPQDIDELLDAMAQRSAAAQRMLNSMTPEQRAELMQLSAQAFGSPALMEQLDRLDQNLMSLRPGEDWGGSEDFGGGPGDTGLGLGDGTGVLQDLADLDALADQIAQSYGGARLDDIDLDKLARQLGNEAAVDARKLKELEQALRESGAMERGFDGELRLTPKAMRQLGKALLRDVAEKMSGRQGQRDLRQAGAAGDLSGATRAWEFGDTEPWDLPRTILNGVLRRAGALRDASSLGSSGTEFSQRLLSIDDVEVAETEARTQAAVALCVDTSFSMAMDGRWVPMKQTALAHRLTLPWRQPRADRLRPPRPDHEDRGAHLPRRTLGQGHQPAPRAAARQPPLPQAPQRPAGAADRHRRRTHLAPRVERGRLLLLPAPPDDDRARRPRAGQRPAHRCPHHLLPAGRGPRPGPLHRLDGAPRRRLGRRAGGRRPRCRGGRVVPRVAARWAPRRRRRTRQLRRLLRLPGVLGRVAVDNAAPGFAGQPDRSA